MDNTQVYVAENDQAIVVAFRGSEAPNTLDGLKDWLLTNANNYLILPEGQSGTDFAAAGVGARFHRGFLDALAMVWEPLFAAVDQALKDQRTAALGHWPQPGWGNGAHGSLAVSAQFPVRARDHHLRGSDDRQRRGSQGLRAGILGQDLRYVDLEDVVPHLPSVSLLANAYTHCLNEVPLSAAEAAAAAAGSRSTQAIGRETAEGAGPRHG